MNKLLITLGVHSNTNEFNNSHIISTYLPRQSLANIILFWRITKSGLPQYVSGKAYRINNITRDLDW